MKVRTYHHRITAACLYILLCPRVDKKITRNANVAVLDYGSCRPHKNMVVERFIIIS